MPFKKKAINDRPRQCRQCDQRSLSSMPSESRPCRLLTVIALVHVVSTAHCILMILRLVHDGSVRFLIAIRNRSEMPPRSGIARSKALANGRVKKRPASSVELMSPGSRPRICSRGLCRRGLIGDGADGEGADDDGERSWLQRGVGADAPDWASHCVQALMPSFEALKTRMGNHFRVV